MNQGNDPSFTQVVIEVGGVPKTPQPTYLLRGLSASTLAAGRQN
jgi:hypothetical protein